MTAGPRELTCRNCGLRSEAAVTAGEQLRCEFCGQMNDATPKAARLPIGDDSKRRVVDRLRESYREARAFVPWAASAHMDAESFSNLEWILGKQRNLENDAEALGSGVSELVVLWLQDLARALETQASLLDAPGAGGAAASTSDARHAAANGLRTATRDFVDTFLSPATGLVSGP